MSCSSDIVLKDRDDGNLVIVDPTLGSEDEDDALMIDCSDEEEGEEDGYDPLSLVSVGLDEDEEDFLSASHASTASDAFDFLFDSQNLNPEKVNNY